MSHRLTHAPGSRLRSVLTLVVLAPLLVAGCGGSQFTVRVCTLPGAISEFSVPTSRGYPWSITVGPNGILWFTEYTGNRIGRIDPTTTPPTITEFMVPTPGSQPYGITAGPNGMLWFTEHGGNRIGRIDPTTTPPNITEFSLPRPGGIGPDGITAAGSNTLWFTMMYGNSIGRIDATTGAITEYLLPTLTTTPQGITEGLDGQPWFTEVGSGGTADRIGRIDVTTTPPTINEYLLPTAGSNPLNITVGPDLNLWFTEYFGERIGQINPRTKGITESPLPVGSSQPNGITTGPNCTLWFTESGLGFIGRMAGRYV